MEVKLAIDELKERIVSLTSRLDCLKQTVMARVHKIPAKYGIILIRKFVDSKENGAIAKECNYVEQHIGRLIRKGITLYANCDQSDIG
jgi:intein-encoded DNA endonuclease-like protein